MAASFPSGKPTLAELATLNNAWQSHPLYQGTIVHYLFNETSGVIAADISGNGLDLTLGGGASFVPDGAQFIGGGQGSSTSPSATLNLLGDMSAEIWLDITRFSNAQDFFHIAGGPGDSEPTNFLMDFNMGGSASAIDVRFFHEFGPGTNVLTSFLDTNIPEDTQCQLVMTRDSVNKIYSLYVDGALFGTASYSENPTIGAGLAMLHVSGNTGVNGNHDSIVNMCRVADRVWSANEIATLFSNPFTLFQPVSQSTVREIRLGVFI